MGNCRRMREAREFKQKVNDSLIDRFSFCLDHRDKGTGECPLCEIERLRRAVKDAMSMFRWYGDLHASKGPDGYEKARRNYEMAQKMGFALTGYKEGETND